MIKPFAATRPGEVLASIVLCLVQQATFLLKRQLQKLETDFVSHGGLRQRMTKARLAARGKSNRE